MTQSNTPGDPWGYDPAGYNPATTPLPSVPPQPYASQPGYDASQPGYDAYQPGQPSMPPSYGPPGGNGYGPAGQPPKQPVNWVLIVIVGVVVLALIGVGIFFLLRSNDKEPPLAPSSIETPSSVVVTTTAPPSTVTVPVPPPTYPTYPTNFPDDNFDFCLAYSLDTGLIDMDLSNYQMYLSTGDTSDALNSVTDMQSQVTDMQTSNPPSSVTGYLTQMSASLTILYGNVSVGQDWSASDLATWNAAYSGLKTTGDLICPS